MNKRKTIPVTEVVDLVNQMLQLSEAGRSDIRQGAINVLEQVLFNTRNYYGFRYLMKNEVISGQPGVNQDETTGEPCADYEARFANTDSTRVHYFK